MDGQWTDGLGPRDDCGRPVTCDLTSLMGGIEYFGESVGLLAGQRTMTRGEGPRVLVKARTIMGGAKLYQPR